MCTCHGAYELHGKIDDQTVLFLHAHVNFVEMVWLLLLRIAQPEKNMRWAWYYQMGMCCCSVFDEVSISTSILVKQHMLPYCEQRRNFSFVWNLYKIVAGFKL